MVAARSLAALSGFTNRDQLVKRLITRGIFSLKRLPDEAIEILGLGLSHY